MVEVSTVTDKEQWYQCPAKVVLPEVAREKVESWALRKTNPVRYRAHYVPADLDHKKVKFNPNFSSGNKGFCSMLPDLPAGFIVGQEEPADTDPGSVVVATA